EGRAVATLAGGRAIVPLELARRLYRQPLRLSDRRVWWSLRPGVWVPGATPACERAGAAWASARLDALNDRELLDLHADAVLCSRDGWPFATTLAARLDRECKLRFDAACVASH